MDPIEEIKAKIDIVPFISEYIQLSRAGRNFKALCPFHKEKTPSFMVSPELGIWRCFGACNEGGDIFKFLMKFEGMDFGEAVRTLAQRAGVTLASFRPRSDREQIYKINSLASQFYNYLLANHPVGRLALTYLKKQRGIKDQTIKEFGLGFAPEKQDALNKFLFEKKGYKPEEVVRAGLFVKAEGKFLDRFQGRIIFPLRDHRGNIVGFSGRILPKDEGKNLGKYVNTPETPVYQKRRHLFGLDLSKDEIKDKNSAVIVEGEFDLLSCWQSGIRNVVCIKGSVLTQDQARLILRFAQNLIFALDRDVAGDRASRAGVLTAEREGLSSKIAALGSFRDPDEAARVDPAGFKNKLSRAKGSFDYFIEQALVKFNPKTAEGVRMISQELTSLFASIQDAILQAHYIKLLAQKLEIPEGAVAAQVDHVAKTLRQPVAQEQKEGVPKPRRQLLEEHLFALSLAHRPVFLTTPQVGVLLSAPVLIRLRGEVTRFLEKNKKKKFSTTSFVKFLPKELVEAASSLLLDPSSNLDYEQKKVLKELDHLLKEIEIIEVQEKIARLTAEIREREGKSFSSTPQQQDLASLIATLSVLSDKSSSN